MSFIIVDPEYPHRGVSNSAVRMMKGAVREFHSEVTAAPAAFLRCESSKDANES